MENNMQAWNSGAYKGWINRFGTPDEAAEKIKENPSKRLGKLKSYIGEDIEGKKVINLLGSNGNKAVALALMGADATVVDYSSDNKTYALELAEKAGVSIRYILSDVLSLPEGELTGDYDVVIMENGILHYFTELKPLFQLVSKLLKTGGRMILQDFHPVSTKLISSRGTTANIRKHKVTGDYFDSTLQVKEVAYSKFLDDNKSESIEKVYLRNWTLGEIITAVATEGLYIKVLEELPNLSSDIFDKGIPKSFIIIADKL